MRFLSITLAVLMYCIAVLTIVITLDQLVRF